MAKINEKDDLVAPASLVVPGVIPVVKKNPEFSFRETIKKSAKEIWDTVKNNKGKIAVVALVALVTGGVGVAVMAGIAGGLVAAKVAKDIAVNYAEANPGGRVAKLVKNVQPVGKLINKVLQVAKNVVKSIGHSLSNIWKTIKNNKGKAALLLVGTLVATIATGGMALPIIAAVAVGGVIFKVAKDVYKDSKAGWHDHQAKPKNIDPLQAELLARVNEQLQVQAKENSLQIATLKQQIVEQGVKQLVSNKHIDKQLETIMTAVQGNAILANRNTPISPGTTPTNNQQSPRSKSR